MAHQITSYLSKIARWLKQHRLDIVICLVLFSVTVAVRMMAMLRFPLEVGLDGAYYTINVYTLINGGYLYYDAPIVSFATAAGFAVLFRDIVFGVKLTSAFYAGLLNVGVYFAARSFTKSDWRAGLVAGALCLVDVSQFQAVTSLVKNEAALAFVPFALAFFYRYISGERRWSDLVGFFIAGTLCTLSHLMTAVLLIAALLVFAGYEFLKWLWQREWRKALLEVALPLIVGGVLFLGIYVAADLLIPAADTWYTSSSLEKASGYSSTFDWSGMVSLLHFFISRLPPNPMDWDLWLQLGVLLLICLGTLVCIVRNTPGDRAALSLQFSCIIVGLAVGTWSWRFRDMYFVPAYIVLSLGLVWLADGLTERVARTRSQVLQRRHAKQAVALGIIVVVLAGMLWVAAPRFSMTAAMRVRPSASPQDLASIAAMQGTLPANVKLYAPHGLEYMITSRTWYEAASEGGSSSWPSQCAYTMYNEETQTSRPTYYVITPGPNMGTWSFTAPENDLVRLETVGSSDFFDDFLNITVFAKQPLVGVDYRFHNYSIPHFMAPQSLTSIGGNYYSQLVPTAGLAEGGYQLQIIPLVTAPPPPPPREDILEITVYRFTAIGSSHVPASCFVQLISSPGAYNIYGVNSTTAAAVDLLNRDLSRPSLPALTRPSELYMVVLTPLFYLPLLSDLSNFILLLVLCPLIGIYWLGAGTLLAWVLQRLVWRRFLKRYREEPS
ncbi:MAG: DUF6541 family protein [Promethearchaeota archaeon]